MNTKIALFCLPLPFFVDSRFSHGHQSFDQLKWFKTFSAKAVSAFQKCPPKIDPTFGAPQKPTKTSFLATNWPETAFFAQIGQQQFSLLKKAFSARIGKNLLSWPETIKTSLPGQNKPKPVSPSQNHPKAAKTSIPPKNDQG